MTPEEREMLLEMPVARALIAEAVAAERARCVAIVRQEASTQPDPYCSEGMANDIIAEIESGKTPS